MSSLQVLRLSQSPLLCPALPTSLSSHQLPAQEERPEAREGCCRERGGAGRAGAEDAQPEGQGPPLRPPHRPPAVRTSVAGVEVRHPGPRLALAQQLCALCSLLPCQSFPRAPAPRPRGQPQDTPKPRSWGSSRLSASRRCPGPDRPSQHRHPGAAEQGLFGGPPPPALPARWRFPDSLTCLQMTAAPSLCAPAGPPDFIFTHEP